MTVRIVYGRVTCVLRIDAINKGAIIQHKYMPGRFYGEVLRHEGLPLCGENLLLRYGTHRITMLCNTSCTGMVSFIVR